MNYDFKTVVDRGDSGSIKWNLMREADPGVPKDIIPLSIGDMELKTPPEIVAGLKEYLDKTILGYTTPTEAYLQAVTGWFRLRHGWEVDSEWILGIDGVVPALYLAVSAFSQPGDGIVYMPPVYRPMYNAIADSGRQPVSVPLLLDADGYHIDFDGLDRALAESGAAMLLFCSPHNPVSRVWTREEMERLAAICLARDVLMVSDDIHMDFVMPGHRHVVYATLSDEAANRCIICTAPSKTFNIAGLQISNIVIPNPDLRRRFHEAHCATGRHGPNQLGLEACRIAYEQCGGWLDAALKLIQFNGETVRNVLREHFPEVRVFDHEGTYFQWLDFRRWEMPAKALEKHMVGKARLFLDEGPLFGPEGEGFERINLACPARVLEDALKRLLMAGR